MSRVVSPFVLDELWRAASRRVGGRGRGGSGGFDLNSSYLSARASWGRKVSAEFHRLLREHGIPVEGSVDL